MPFRLVIVLIRSRLPPAAHQSAPGFPAHHHERGFELLSAFVPTAIVDTIISGEPMDEIKRSYSREELHELVWSIPMRKLAERFGVSDRGLAKTCARHLIPVPPRGYWAKLEAGQSVKKTPLRAVENTDLHKVAVGSVSPPPTPFVASIIEAAIKQASEWQTASPQIDPPKSRVRAATPETARNPSEPIAPEFEVINEPHLTIRGLCKELRTSKTNADGEVRLPGIRIHKSNIERVVSILDSIALQVGQSGTTLSQEENALRASIGKDWIDFRIAEGLRREKHAPTDEELESKRRYEKRREAANRRGQWLPPEKFWPEYDFHYLGTLTFEVDNWAQGARKKWADGKQQTLEGMIDGIVSGIQYHLAYEKAKREGLEESQRRREHLAARRKLHQRRIEREGKRLEFLKQLADYQREAADLRVTIAAASSIESGGSPEYQRMIEWACRRLATIEAYNNIAALDQTLKENNLFPENDELFDPEGDPPPKTNYWDD
ncbi:hypothetical protein PY650_30930 [Rhizobium calliandrae]|uniref:Uncharacterized protein n=1 Tax=Rhizobium calliandrae TaxID=1312182 RepID=A0ABT7KRH7_9HYPH|nr:hypothetical protein [Rhizobium calliandrae]MDL2409954.1 hypothetical protein [Rhizobium calliandrae]